MNSKEMVKIRDLLQKKYDEYKEKYQEETNKLSTLKEDRETEWKRLIEEGYSRTDIYFNRNGISFKYKGIVYNIEQIERQQPILFQKLSKLNEILNNNEHIISLKRNELEKFSRDKLILEVGISAIGDSNSNLKGKVRGGISGFSFLGFGNTNGSINGYIDSNSNSHYEEYILVKYKYNLDYEIEEFLFNVDDYLKKLESDE